MSDDAPMFVFEMRYISRNTDTYYVADWFDATKIAVVAATRDAAIEKARTALGTAPRNYVWAFKIDSIRDILIPTTPKETP